MSEILVVKLGGTTIAEQRQTLDEVAELARRRPVVLVHGGGKRATDWLERLGVPTRFEDGLRVTDSAALEVTTAVLRGVVNSELVAALRERGCDAVGLSGLDGGLLVGQRVPGKGLVAQIADVRRDLLDAILVGGHVPVVAPLAFDESGTACNVNADDVAAGIARGLGARQLVLLTDVDGIRGPGGRRVATLDAARAERLIASDVIAGGMIPKIRAALRAVEGRAGVEAVIADAAAPDALRRAVEDRSFGTRIVGPPERRGGVGTGAERGQAARESADRRRVGQRAAGQHPPVPTRGQ